MRARIERNQRQDGILRNEAFIQKRLERHINPKGHFERTFSDRKTYQICEFKTQSGGVVIFRIDVTEQKKSEQELQISQERLSNAVGSLKEGFGYFDANDRLVACNQKFMETRPGIKNHIKPGITYEGFLRIPANAEHGYDDEVRDETWFQERLEQHLNPKGPLYRTLKDGRTIQVDDIKTKDVGIVTVRTDIAELGDLREVGSLKETVNAMSIIVEQLLALARLDALVIREPDTADLIDISTKVSMQLGPIAIRYSRRGDLVTTKVDSLGTIKVIDHGEGIPKEIRNSIFNRFEYADRRGDGSGLGLSLVRRTVDAHGGTIEVSDTPGSGATFTINLSKPAARNLN